MSNSTLDRLPSETWVRSVYRWAVSVAIVTFPLIWIGGLVTTYDAGMAVPDWPGTYGYNLWLYPWTTWLFGPFDLFVEHGHRLLATVVGMLTIVYSWQLIVLKSGDGLRPGPSSCSWR